MTSSKTKWITATTLGLLGLAASASASVTHNYTWSIVRSVAAGTSYKNMVPTSTHFCALETVGVENTDASGELARCNIDNDGNVWTLEATLGTGDATVQCKAYCFTRS
jgi:hypothetical protein